MRLLSFAAAVLLAMFASGASAGRFSSPFETGPVTTAPATFVVKIAGGEVDVVEYFNAALGHYFISADPAEIKFLDSGPFGGAWKRTGGTFPAWDINGAPAGTVPVCRFFGTDRYRTDGSRIGPNSHFYTADPAECAFVKTAWQSVANDGNSYPAWTFEANAFAVRLPVNGACPAGTQPLFRAYNNAAGGDPNHRYSTQLATLQAMAGWIVEGLVMCLPQPGQSITLPAQLAGCTSGACPPATEIGSGIGLVNVVITVTNTTSESQELLIPAGRTFVATPTTFQDGLLAERVRATLAAGASRTFVLKLFCMQAKRSATSSSASYAPGPVTTNASLLDIVTLADGKLDITADPLGLKALGVQYTVWEVTDGAGSLKANQRALLQSLLATAADDLLAQVTLSQQLFDTLSVVPGN